MCFSIFEKKKCRLVIKQNVEKVEKLRYFQRGYLLYSIVLVKNWPFSNLFILAIIGQENVFFDIPEGKNVCLSYKNKKLKKPQN